MLRNRSDFDFDLSGSFKVKYNSIIGLPIYGFLVVSSSNIWPNSPPLRDISFQNPSDLDIDLARSVTKVKYNPDPLSMKIQEKVEYF